MRGRSALLELSAVGTRSFSRKIVIDVGADLSVCPRRDSPRDTVVYRCATTDNIQRTSAQGGVWGLLAVGIFANGNYGGVSGLIAGNSEQIVAQPISMVTVYAWAFATGYALFWGIKKTIGLRASEEEELEGLDRPEHGVLAYPELAPEPAAGD